MLIVRDGRVVQSVQFKHTNVIHYDAIHAIECFNKWAVDEIVVLNVSREPDTRASFLDTIEHISSACFVPLSAGGWITELDYAQQLLARGADKLVINTALADDPELVESVSRRFGRQCVIASIDIKQNDQGSATVRVDRGRRDTGSSLVRWAQQAVDLGAGEVFFNSIDHDGFRKGYDLDNLGLLIEAVDVPVIAFGGVFNWEHLLEGVNAGASAVAAANIFHYTEHSTKKAKKFLVEAGVQLRKEPTF